jgi:methionyl-tRNA formyltransferase
MSVMNERAKIVFMGTPDFAVPALKRLIMEHDVIGVVTQPDRPAGRGGAVQMSPVKLTAIEENIPVFQPEKIRRLEAVEELKQWTADVYIVAAFGQILPQTVLDIPLHGSVNIHASLLPRWRGAAPIQAAIRAGDTHSGITIMKMDAGLDTGPMLSQRSVKLLPDESGQTLHDTLSMLGGELLIDTLPAYLRGDITPQPQDDSLATFAPRIDKNEGHINWSHSAAEIERTVRAFTPWPGTFTYWNGKLLKIINGGDAPGQVAPGQVVKRGELIAIGTGDGLFYPSRVQLEGKKVMIMDDFMRGYPAFVGATLT